MVISRKPLMRLRIFSGILGWYALVVIIPPMKCDDARGSTPSSALREIWKQIENDIDGAGGIDAEMVNYTSSEKRHFLDTEDGGADNTVRLLDYFRRRNRDGECNPETNVYPCGALDFLGCTGNKKFYAESVIRLNWFEAWEFCRNNGMHLASVESTYEQVFLELFLPKPEAGATEGYWLSGTDFGREGLFYWMNSGKSFTYTNWRSSEPNNYNGREHCVQLISNLRSSDALRWNDVQCNKVGYVICEEPYDRKPSANNAFDWVQERDNSHRNKIITVQVQGKTSLKDEYPNLSARVGAKGTSTSAVDLDAPAAATGTSSSGTTKYSKQTTEGYSYEKYKYKTRQGYSPILSALAEAAE